MANNSLVAPLAIWFDYPAVPATHVVATNDGETMAVALENGNIWLFARTDQASGNFKVRLFQA
jgi:hypothetical protein